MSAEQSFFIRKLAILGLGLIGGSLAKALKAQQAVGEVMAFGHREASLKRGVELGVVDSYSLNLADIVKDADVVVVATPTIIAEKMLVDVLQLVSGKTIVTDVASVKGNLLRAVNTHFPVSPANLVLAHPIAGSEKSGVDAAKADLFLAHRVILTPLESTSADALTTIRRMWQLAGADVIDMPVDEHDSVLAATSHLPHLLAYALVDALAGLPEQQAIFRFAAGGFRDFTRIAASDPQMWHDIVLANRDALLNRLDQVTTRIAELRDQIAAGDGESIKACFARAKTARDTFGSMLADQQKTSNNSSISHE